MENVVPKINLLLVDDHPNNLIALESVLKGPEYNLIYAKSGPEALEQIEKNDVALVLLDIQMPGMDGFETAKRMKASARGREIPIIFITAVYKEDPFIKKGYDVGAVDYFSKPFDPDILKMKVGIYTAFHQKTHLLKEREKRIRATEELLEAGRKLTDVLENLPVGVLIADSEGRVIQINEEISRIWGFKEPIDADRYGEFINWWEEDGQLIKSGPIARAIKNGEYSKNELIMARCFDGSTKGVLTSTSPLRNLDGAIVGVVVVVQDITERRKIEKDMEQRIQKLITIGIELQHSSTH